MKLLLVLAFALRLASSSATESRSRLLLSRLDASPGTDHVLSLAAGNNPNAASASYGSFVFGTGVVMVMAIAALSWALMRYSGQASEQRNLRHGVAFCVFILACYCSFSLSHTFFQHRSASVSLAPVVPTTIIYVLKLIIAVSMYCSQDGSFSQLVQAIVSSGKTVFQYSVPAACLAFYDVFSFMTLAKLNPSQYQVLLYLRLFFVVVGSVIFLGKRLTLTMWALLVSCTCAVLLTERANIVGMTASGEWVAGLSVYGTLGLQLGLSITGNLTNEFFLTRMSLTVNAQNVVLYGLATAILCTTLGVASLISGPMFEMRDFPKLLNFNVLMSIFTLSLLGISTSFLLKYLGNIWKELARMAVTVITASIDWFVFNTRVPMAIDFMAVTILTSSMAAFGLLERLEGVEEEKIKKKKKKGSEDTEKA